MRVRAKVPMYYGRRMYAVGDEYDMDDRESNEAMILDVLGKIEVVKAATAPAAPTYNVAAFKAEQAAAEPDVPAEPMTTENTEALAPGKRVYRRRDMKAEQ